MQKSKLFLLFMIFVLMLSACTSVALDPVAPTSENKQTDVPTATLDPTPTNTLIPTLTPTNTLEPTPTPTPTPTLIPTPTLPVPLEMSLDPSYIQTVSTEYMGVTLNLELITDSSLNPELTKVTVDGDSYAHVMAYNIFRIWWVKGAPANKLDDIPTDDDFISFMHLWARAQETNSFEDWEKVQIDGLYANDLNDRYGYGRKAYSVWFMYNGQDKLPYGIKSVKLLTVALVKYPNQNTPRINIFGPPSGFGLNLNGYNLIACYADSDIRFAESISGSRGIDGVISVVISSIHHLLLYNNVYAQPDHDFEWKALVNGMKIYPEKYP